MEKRFQVFISSTYEDLREARAAVSEALLRANCFPAGMELFPAADSEQFEFIKEVIDQSDYYLVVSAGRYGSISPETGLGYTEMEYDYAVETGKPVIRLLHTDPLNKLTGERIERTDDGRKMLEAFRAKLKTGSLVAFWDDAKELKAETLLALQDIQRRKPAVGWVRGDTALDAAEALEVSRMRKKLAELEKAEQERRLEAKKKSSLEWSLPTAERVLSAVWEEFDWLLYVELILSVGRLVAKNINYKEELADYISDGEFDPDLAMGFLDALFVDRFLSIKGNFISITATGEMVLSKIRLQSMDVDVEGLSGNRGGSDG